MKKILTALTFLLISTLFFACSDSKDEPGPDPIKKATLEVTATLDLTATDKTPTRAGEVTLADLTYVITNTGAKTEVDKGQVPADGKLKALTLDAGTYSVAITSSATGMPKPGFDTPIYGRTETVVLKAGDNKKLPVKSTQQNAGINFTFADFTGAAVVATIVHTDGTLVYAANDDKKIGYFGPATVEATFTVDGAAIKVNGKDKETLTLKAGELWKIKLSKTEASGAWVLAAGTDPDPDPVDELLEGKALADYYGGTTSTNLFLNLYSADKKMQMSLDMFTKPTTFANVELAVGEYKMVPAADPATIAPMSFFQGELDGKSIYPSCFFGRDAAGALTEFWVPSTSGKIVVSKAGDIYTIAATFSGTYYENKQGGTNKPFTDLTWTFKGKLDWLNETLPVMDAIKAGAWDAAGTGGFVKEPGPNTFALTLTKKTNLLEFMGWAGDKGLPLWLYVNDNRFTTDPKDVSDQFEGYEAYNIYFCGVAVYNGKTYNDATTKLSAAFDKRAQTLRLGASFTIDGNSVDAHFGYMAIEKTTKDTYYLGDLYKNLTFTYKEGVRVGVSYSNKISAAELNALISSGKLEMVNLPIDVKVDTPSTGQRYVSSYDAIFR